MPELPEVEVVRQGLARGVAGRTVTYQVLDVEGPAHERRFSCGAQIDGVEVGAGTGRTKKEAEQAAAKQALAAVLAEQPPV